MSTPWSGLSAGPSPGASAADAPACATVVGSGVASWTVPAAGHALILRGDHTVWWADTGTLFVADVHLGKDERFRRLGVPVPVGPTLDTLDRLALACSTLGARSLVVLGDLLHARGSATPALGRRWSDWRATVPALEVVLVRGNHDRQSGDPPPDWRVRVVPEGEPLQGLRLCHEPPEPGAVDAAGSGASSGARPGAPPGGYALAGHVHPGVRLHGRAGDRLRLPCFVHGPSRLVLPAFGAFTGLHLLQPAAGERRYAVCEGRIAAV